MSFTLIIGLILKSLGQKSVYAYESYGEIVESGNCVENATYVLYDSGTLVISRSRAIFYKAFYKNQNFKTVIISDGITSIEGDAFAKCDILDIYCYSGSDTERYAKENNIPYRLIDIMW